MDIHEIRRSNLRSLVREYANGSLTRFVEVKLRDSISYKVLQRVLSPKANRNLGLALARRIEAKLKLERGWIDQNRSGVEYIGPVPGGHSERVMRLVESFESLPPPIRAQIEELVRVLAEQASKSRPVGSNPRTTD